MTFRDDVESNLASLLAAGASPAGLLGDLLDSFSSALRHERGYAGVAARESARAEAYAKERAAAEAERASPPRAPVPPIASTPAEIAALVEGLSAEGRRLTSLAAFGERDQCWALLQTLADEFRYAREH